MKMKVKIKKEKPTTIESTYVAEPIFRKIVEQEAMDIGMGTRFYEDPLYAYDARKEEPKPLCFMV